MVQPAFELPVESLNHSATEPTMLATLLFIDLIVASTSETFQHILCSQDRLTTSPLDRRCSKGGEEWGLLETDCVIFLDHDPTFLLDDPSIHPPIIHWSVSPSVRPSDHPFIHPSFSPSTHFSYSPIPQDFFLQACELLELPVQFFPPYCG